LAVVAVYAIAGAVAAVGGILYASTFGALKLSLGWSATVIAFTAAVIGGRASVVGAVLGGLALGVGTTFLLYFLPSGYRDAVAFVLLAMALLALPPRPAGAAVAD
jgi:branched-subunit amino acid ABC-type transport system permease component